MAFISQISNLSSSPLYHHHRNCFQLASTSWSPVLTHSSSSFQLLAISSSLEKSFFCNSCKCSKMHRFPFYNSTIKSNAPLEYIYSDVWGPLPEISIDGFQYYLIFVDHYTKYIWFFPIKRKSDVSIIFSKFKKVVEKLF